LGLRSEIGEDVRLERVLHDDCRLAIAVNLVLGIDKLITGHLQPEPNEKGIFAMELIVFGMLMERS